MKPKNVITIKANGMLTILNLECNQQVKFNYKRLPQNIQQQLIIYGLKQKLLDISCLDSGIEAINTMKKTFKMFLSGYWIKHK